ncbi:DEAD/DEAH box helicase family protein [Flavobacteriaceae bacterium]|nr:DEAD/DEAH box helicase family protein [Flavobacteriaceae bacterium]
MNESQTEFEYIDPALREAGWGVVEGSRVRKQFPITQGRLLGQGRKSQPLKADYLLEYKNRKLAIVEAKKRDLYYTEGVGQAKDYADRLNIQYTYSTNGLEIYQINMDSGEEGDVSKFPTPDELWRMTFPEEDLQRDSFNSVPFESKGGKWQPRYYQENAINKVLESVSAGEKRILLTLATGTGKTAIAFQIAWKLFQSKWNLISPGSRVPRILFLADRNILADQAFNSFGAFDDDALVRIKPGEIKKKGKVPTNGSLFFTIFQSFMSGPNDSPYFGEYPPDYFDFIVIDECHRGGANDESSWRDIMEYFKPAVQLGLTATPKRDVNIDTYDYFGDPVYIYSLKEGINDGFLTPFKVKEIDTTLDEYTFNEGDDVLFGEIEKGKEYQEKDFNRSIQIKSREEYRVKLFLSMINQNQKTLVFCATQRHALLVRDLINQHSDSLSANYCHRVTADDGKIGEQHLRDFQDNEKSIPTILTTSQKLSTGVDAPEIRNIVLMRPVNSMVEFKQIVGRGTRLFDKKDHFTIYDFVEAHDHFQDEQWDGPPLKPEIKETSSKPPNDDLPQDDSLIDDYNDDEPTKKMVKIKLSQDVVREINSTVSTTFWDPQGKPISAEEFMQSLFGDIPKFFESEDQLINIWSVPETREKLLETLSEAGYSVNQLEDLRKLVNGQESDLFDVLSYVAFHSDLIPRLERRSYAKIHLDSYDTDQQEFLNFVLDQYVKKGVAELSDDKLKPLIELKYNTIADAKKVLGSPIAIRETFIGFQKYLYSKATA